MNKINYKKVRMSYIAFDNKVKVHSLLWQRLTEGIDTFLYNINITEARKEEDPTIYGYIFTVGYYLEDIVENQEDLKECEERLLTGL